MERLKQMKLLLLIVFGCSTRHSYSPHPIKIDMVKYDEVIYPKINVFTAGLELVTALSNRLATMSDLNK